MTPILEVQNLKQKVSEEFTFGPFTYQFAPGVCVALIGPNGAGKSTFFSLITGNSDPTEGEILLGGEKFRPEFYLLKRRIGYLSQNIDLPNWVTPWELLNYSANLHDLSESKRRIEHQIDLWAISPYLGRPLGACSHGMKKRVGLALSLLHQPELLILDEPFAGLDVLHINSLKNIIHMRTAEEQATILSTHILPYAATLAGEALTIQTGRVEPVSLWKDVSYEEKISQVESHILSSPSEKAP